MTSRWRPPNSTKTTWVPQKCLLRMNRTSGVNLISWVVTLFKHACLFEMQISPTSPPQSITHHSRCLYSLLPHNIPTGGRKETLGSQKDLHSKSDELCDHLQIISYLYTLLCCLLVKQGGQHLLPKWLWVKSPVGSCNVRYVPRTLPMSIHAMETITTLTWVSISWGILWLWIQGCTLASSSLCPWENWGCCRLMLSSFSRSSFSTISLALKTNKQSLIVLNKAQGSFYVI